MKKSKGKGKKHHELFLHPAHEVFLCGVDQYLSLYGADPEKLSYTDDLNLAGMFLGLSKTKVGDINRNTRIRILEILFHGVSLLCRPNIMTFKTIAEWLNDPVSEKVVPEELLKYPVSIGPSTHYLAEFCAYNNVVLGGKVFTKHILLTERGPVEITCEYVLKKRCWLKYPKNLTSNDRYVAIACDISIRNSPDLREVSFRSYAFLATDPDVFFKTISKLRQIVESVKNNADRMSRMVSEVVAKIDHFQRSISL